MLKTIAKNTLLLSASQIIARGVGFLYVIFLARTLGVENFGLYFIILAFMYNFVPVADFGLERLVLRDISRKPEEANYYFSKLFSLRVFLWLIAVLSALIISVFAERTAQEMTYLAIVGLSLLPYSLSYLIVAFRNAEEKMESLSIVNIFITLLTAFFGVIFILLHFSMFWILSAYFFGNLATFVILLFRLPSWKLTVKLDIDLNFWFKCLSGSWVFATLLIISVFYLRLSVLFLNYFKDAFATGLYGSAFKFVEAGILIPQSLALALFPLSAKLFLVDKNRLRRIYLKGLLVLFLLSLPVVAVFALFPNLILGSAYGQEYLPASGALVILSFSFIFFFVNSLSGNIIQNSPKVKKFLPFSIANLLIAAGLCILLIPKFSFIGAAWAVLGGEAAGFFINNLFVFHLLKNEQNS